MQEADGKTTNMMQPQRQQVGTQDVSTEIFLLERDVLMSL